jgi:site-specific recombinase XerD
MAQKDLTPRENNASLIDPVMMWADAITDPDSTRRLDLIRDKQAILISDGLSIRKYIRKDGTVTTRQKVVPMGFLTYTGKPAHLITAIDVKAWQGYLEGLGLSQSSIYARISRVSSFYVWLLEQAEFQDKIRANPVVLARPKAPKAYQNQRAKALSDDDVKAFFKVVKQDMAAGKLTAIRDYAMLRLYFATGKRRAEIAMLKWGDLSINGKITMRSKEKGGIYRNTEILDTGVKDALFTYIRASGRWNVEMGSPNLSADDPLWLRHDRAAEQALKDGKPLGVTSHGFVKTLKSYAKRAGLEHIHLHQTRHTVARKVGEISGDVSAVQAVLNHQKQATTKVYLDSIAVKKDRFSTQLADAFELD